MNMKAQEAGRDKTTRTMRLTLTDATALAGVRSPPSMAQAWFTLGFA
jgi:hypothetical protein